MPASKALSIALGLTLAVPAFAKPPAQNLGIEREALQSRLTAALARLEFIAPIGEFECKKPSVLRYCWAPAGNAIRVDRTETFVGSISAAQFQGGAPGQVFEVTATLDLAKADNVERDRFDGLCAAIALAAYADLTPAAAIAQQRKLTISAANRSGGGQGVATARRGPKFFAVQVRPEQVICGAHVYGQRDDLLK